MNAKALAALHRRAQYVADCALLALYTDDEWHNNNLRSALANFDKAHADLVAAQAPERGTLDPHGGDDG